MIRALVLKWPVIASKLFYSVLDIVALVKEVKLKQRTEPWMNSKILQNIRYRDETLNKFRKTKDPDLYRNILST